MMVYNRTAGLILAAGRSSRMGEFKPLLPLGESNIILSAVDRLRSCCEEITVIVGHNAQQLAEALPSWPDLTTIFNRNYETAPMFSSVLLGVAHFKDRCDRLFILPCDMPAFSEHTLHVMLKCMDDTGATAVKPTFNGKSGHPVLIGAAMFCGILGYDGQNGLAGAICTLGGAQAVAVPDYGILLDADTPQDYDLLLQYIESSDIHT